MSSKRRLAAIIFADIAGYTSMMQENEEQGTIILKRYNEALTEKIESFSGEIIKRYGDGTLILFSSAINALNCSIALQESYRQDPSVPVRIGIHLGEVTERDNDYFGNDINVCARIESMGVPGSILISKEVFDKTKNQPNIHTKTLGKFLFKNIPEPLEVFAVINEGLIVPDKKKVKGKFEAQKPFWQKHKLLTALITIVLLIGGWQASQYLEQQGKVIDENFLLNKKVAILPFENISDDSTLQVLGLMATDWITQTLLTNNAGKVVNIPTDINEEIKTSEGLKSFLEKSGAEILINGRYYEEDQKVYINSNIVDASNMDILHTMNPVVEDKENPILMLNNLQEKLMGYWFLGSDKWVGSNPPKYSAYKLFLSLRETWQSDYKSSRKTLDKAFEEDSTFYRPLISLASLYYNEYEFSKSDSIVNLIEAKNYPLSDFEKLRIETIKSSLNGYWNKAAEISEEIFKTYNVYEQGIDACYYGLRSNKPTKIIELVNNFNELQTIGDCYQCQKTFSTLVQSHMALEEYTKVVKLIEPIMQDVIDADIAVTHLRALTKLYQMEKVDEALEIYKIMDLEWYGYYNQNLLYWAICQELYLTDKMTSLQKYTDEMYAFAEKHPDNITYEQDIYTCHFFKGQIDSAIVHASKWVSIAANYGLDYEADLVFLNVLKGNTLNGEKFLEVIKPEGLKYDHGQWEYNRAKVHTALGQHEEAVKLLSRAIEAGHFFSWYTYQNDLFFKDLLKEETFQELVKVKD